MSRATAPASRAGGGRAPLRVVKGGRSPAPARWLSTVSTRAALVWITGALCVVGLVMVLCASAYTSLQYYGSVWTIFERQLLWMAIGTLAFVATCRIRYDRWRRLRLLLLVGSFFLLFVVLLPGVSPPVGGASRWIGIGQLKIQPSELMKLALAVFAADLLTRRADQVEQTRRVVAPLLVMLGLAAVLVLEQPDMGTAIVLVCIVFGLLFAGGVPVRPVLKALAVTAALGLVVGMAEPYRRARLLSFINPFAHARGSGYQVVQSLVGLGSGRLYGLGLGGGHQQWGLLPNAHTDFIFSVVGEDGGLVGALAVLALFVGLAWFGLRAASRAPDRFGGLLAVAATCWITSQAIINIGAVIGILPVTGIPLPFISFGGSSLVVTMVAAGILVNVAAHERAPGSPRPSSRPRRSASR
ncbi:MAG: putative lipid II flippase FtsW [Acidimicrobiales bacterium]